MNPGSDCDAAFGAGYTPEYMLALREMLSNAHGAPMQDAKSKYQEDLSNIPGLEVKVNGAEPTFQWCSEDYKQRNPAYDGLVKREKEPPPMEKTEVAAMIEKAKQDMKQYAAMAAAEVVGLHVRNEHVKPYRAPRSRAPWYIAGYVLAALGTFVHLQHYDDSFSKITDKGDRVFLSITVTTFWPVYWVGTGLYYVGQGVLALDDYAASAFKPTPKAPAKSCTDDRSGSWAPDAEGVCHMPNLPGAQ